MQLDLRDHNIIRSWEESILSGLKLRACVRTTGGSDQSALQIQLQGKAVIDGSSIHLPSIF